MSDFSGLCVKYGSQVSPLPDYIEGARLLWALGGNESSFGVNLKPRHEPAYDIGGSMAKNPSQLARLETFGSEAACSYGRWQLMFANAPQGAKPSDFDDPDTDAQYAVAFLNSQLRRFRPLTLTTIGMIWNHGSPTTAPSPGVAAYVAELCKNYDVPMEAA